jgi:FkbM family methyltransferase
MRLMRTLGIDLVLDVGANSGQFGAEIRRYGYQGRIVSFEPLRDPFTALSNRAARDPQWEARQEALADFEGSAQMNIAGNSASSSLLAMLPLHDRVAPHARYIGTEEVVVRRLDGISSSLLERSRSAYLKIDVQGAEEHVIAGASATLRMFAAVQLELSLFGLYDGAPLFNDIVATMHGHGFRLAGLEPGLAATDGWLLQADGLFVHTNREPPALTTRSVTED